MKIDGISAARAKYEEIGQGQARLNAVGLSDQDLAILKAAVRSASGRRPLLPPGAPTSQGAAFERIAAVLALAAPQPTVASYLVGEARGEPVFVNAMAQPNGSTKWKVCRDGGSGCLDKKLMQFVYEPQPSSRTDEFKRTTRFSLAEAFDLAAKYIDAAERATCQKYADFYREKLGTDRVAVGMGLADPKTLRKIRRNHGTSSKYVHVYVDTENAEKAKALRPQLGYHVKISGGLPNLESATPGHG
jgi:hypothetical protein